MRILLTGSTGFIGRALVPRLQRNGHSIVAWVRSDTRATALLGADVDIVSIGAGQDALVAAMSGCDAVVNLSGEPLLGKRWTPKRRAVLRASRVGVTTQIVAAIEAASPRPRVLVSGSAVGFYGDRGDEVLTESSSPREDFLSRLCQEWEQSAAAPDVRVVLVRTGVVLGREGGALAQMLPPFMIGAGGPIGSGRQYFPWIHLHDLVNLIAAAIEDDRYRGPVNAVAPEQATSRTFAKALGRALRRPAFIPIPTLALRAIFGDAAVVLTASQRVEPAVAKRLGFTWEFPTLDAALRDVVGDEVQNVVSVAAGVEEVKAFLEKPANLNILRPSRPGIITYMVRTAYDPVCTVKNGRTLIEDRLNYRIRIGLLAGLLNRLFVARRLRAILKYRADIMRLRFG